MALEVTGVLTEHALLELELELDELDEVVDDIDADLEAGRSVGEGEGFSPPGGGLLFSGGLSLLPPPPLPPPELSLEGQSIENMSKSLKHGNFGIGGSFGNCIDGNVRSGNGSGLQ